MEIFLRDILEKGSTVDLKEENISNKSNHVSFSVEKNLSNDMTYFLNKLSVHLDSSFHLFKKLKNFFIGI